MVSKDNQLSVPKLNTVNGKFVKEGGEKIVMDFSVLDAESILGATYDLICDAALMQTVKDEFAENKKVNA